MAFKIYRTFCLSLVLFVFVIVNGQLVESPEELLAKKNTANGDGDANAAVLQDGGEEGSDKADNENNGNNLAQNEAPMVRRKRQFMADMLSRLKIIHKNFKKSLTELTNPHGASSVLQGGEAAKRLASEQNGPKPAGGGPPAAVPVNLAP